MFSYAAYSNNSSDAMRACEYLNLFIFMISEFWTIYEFWNYKKITSIVPSEQHNYNQNFNSTLSSH